MKKLSLTIAALFFALLTFAQGGVEVTGKVNSTDNKSATTVYLLSAKDSSLQKTAIADEEGAYQFKNLATGKYLLKFTAVGSATAYSSIYDIQSKDVMVSDQMLSPITKEMEAVVVQSKREFIERRIDKMVINPDAMLTNAGTTALEVLEKSPGVEVDKDGNISLRGKQGVIIMIDGKPSYMSSSDMSNYLRGLSSSTIDQIELMTNPSAKYDAAGNSGIINIKIKKIKQRGFNGSFTTSYGQGVYAKSNSSLQLNYRKDKLNIFGNLSGNYREDFQEINIHRTYLNNDESVQAIFEQTAFTKKYRNSYGGNVGADYYVNKNTTVGMNLSGNYNPRADRSFNTSFLKDRNEITDSIATAEGREDAVWKNVNLNFNVRHTIDTTGRYITADLDYLRYDSKQDQMLINSSFQNDWTKKGSDHLIGNLPSIINIYAAKVDYTHPLKKEAKLEVGLKTSVVDTDNTADYFNKNGNTITADYDKTNAFAYKENINAAYINYSRQIKKWGIQAGLRVENTNINGLQYGNPTKSDSAFKRSYTNAFPTGYVSYQANKKNSFGFSVGRRISRPDYEDLNPFLFFIDKYTYNRGNPFLRPAFSTVYEVNHSYSRWLQTSLNYSKSTDLINEEFTQEGFATVVGKGNYGVRHQASLSSSARLKPTKQWTMMLYAEGRYQQYKGNVAGNDLNFDVTTGQFSLNNQFRFKKGWSAELSGFYTTKFREGQIKINPLGRMDVGVAKEIWKKKGNLKLTVRDLLYTQLPSGSINFQNTLARFDQLRDSRVVTITFVYRFGKPIKGLKQRKSGGADSEQSRVKGE